MPIVNPLARELVFKIVYYGPGLGGKTTSLQSINDSVPAERKGRLISLATPVDRTLYFDFLPLRLSPVRGLSVRLQLYTVPGQVHFNATRRLVLTGADGVVMVIDSQRARQDANLESLANLKANLAEQGRTLSEVPHVFQWNKRDLPEIDSEEQLERQLNELAAPAFATNAVAGQGVREALAALTKAVLADFEGRLPGREDGGQGGLLAPEPGLVQALEGTEPSAAPGSPVSSEVMLSAPSLPSDLGQFRDANGSSNEDDSTPRSTDVVAAPAIDLPKTEVARMQARFQEDTLPSGRGRPLVDGPQPKSLGGIWSFDELFPSQDQELARETEAALSVDDWMAALDASERLVAKLLSVCGAMLGGGAPRDPISVVLLLSLPAGSYLEFRQVVRRARRTGPNRRDALDGYAFALELARAVERFRR